jgi:hypothetical protein
MTKEQLAPWVEKLNAAEPKEYVGIVDAMCEENGIKKNKAWTALKEAGFVKKVSAPLAAQSQKSDGTENKDETTPGNTGAAQTGANQPSNKAAGKKRIKHPELKGSKIIAGDKLVEFDADGIAELEADVADRLLRIPGYEEVEK